MQELFLEKPTIPCVSLLNCLKYYVRIHCWNVAESETVQTTMSDTGGLDFMSLADKIFVDMCNDILNNGIILAQMTFLMTF